MKKRLYRAKVVLFMLSGISVMGMTACSFNPKEETAPAENIQLTEGNSPTSITESEILAYIIDVDKVTNGAITEISEHYVP